MTITVGRLLLIIAALVAAVALFFGIVARNHHTGTSQESGVPEVTTQTEQPGDTNSRPGITAEQTGQLVMGDSKSVVAAKLGGVGEPYNHNMGAIKIPGETGGMELPEENDCWLYSPQPTPTNVSQNIVAACFDAEGKLNYFMGPWAFGDPGWPQQS